MLYNYIKTITVDVSKYCNNNLCWVYVIYFVFVTPQYLCLQCLPSNFHGIGMTFHFMKLVVAVARFFRPCTALRTSSRSSSICFSVRRMQPPNKSGVLSSSLGTLSAAICCENKKVKMTVTFTSTVTFVNYSQRLFF